MDEIQRVEQKVCEIEKEVKRITKIMEKIEYWAFGNGTTDASAATRISWILNHMITIEHIDRIVGDVVKEQRKQSKNETTKDWNKWVNTGLLVIAVIGVYLQFIGG